MSPFLHTSAGISRIRTMTLSTDDELSRFREEWIKEVQAKRSHVASLPVDRDPPSMSTSAQLLTPATIPLASDVGFRDIFQKGRNSIPVVSPSLVSAMVRHSATFSNYCSLSPIHISESISPSYRGRDTRFLRRSPPAVSSRI
jgi:hypothetical protein